MASFAKLNNENIVIQVISVNNAVITDSNGIEQESLGIEFLRNLYNDQNSIWKKTSYNSMSGTYYNTDPITGERTLGDQSKIFRKNYAGIGYTYDEQRDAFIEPKLFNSWVLDESTCRWKAPVPMPSETNEDGTPPKWNEDTLQWVFNNN
jgi:hypothetical protein